MASEQIDFQEADKEPVIENLESNESEGEIVVSFSAEDENECDEIERDDTLLVDTCLDGSVADESILSKPGVDLEKAPALEANTGTNNSRNVTFDPLLDHTVDSIGGSDTDSNGEPIVGVFDEPASDTITDPTDDPIVNPIVDATVQTTFDNTWMFDSDSNSEPIVGDVNEPTSDTNTDSTADHVANPIVDTTVGTAFDNTWMFDPDDFENPTWNTPTQGSPGGHCTGNTNAIPSSPANQAALYGPNKFPNPVFMSKIKTSANGSLMNWKKIANRLKHSTYPEDCYSFMALHNPIESREKAFFFLFGLGPFIFQMIFLCLLIWSETSYLTGTIGETDNPEREDEDRFLGFLASFIPTNASPIVRCTQVVSIAAYVAFPDASLKDVIKAVQLFPQPTKVESSDPIVSLRVSCLLRAIQGTLAMLVTLLLVATTDTVVDIILNFTAVNFISSLDDYAFELALFGDFGVTLQAEAERISTRKLPPCLSLTKARRFVYNRLVVGLTSMILFGLIIFVISAQKSNDIWVTQTLRVQFQESTGLDEYNGCFRLNHDRSSIFFSRRSYNSIGIGSTNSSFGYCRSDRQWILFEGDDIVDPCSANNSDLELARSSKTDTFDISTSFESSWVSASNTPLDMYFFDNETEIEEHCDAGLNDGICDSFFNRLGYDYDGGDCCASTCTRSQCGRTGFSALFGSDVSGIHYPHCRNPTMVPLTIRLNSISSSRDVEFDVFESEWDQPWGPDGSENEWRNATPVDPYFALDCADNNIFTVYIEPTMVKNSETVMVDDAASCKLVVRNATTITRNIATNDPTWLINYTIFHGESERVPILTQHSSEVEVAHFKRIPACYFQMLGDYVDVPSIYTGSDPSNAAIEWLADEFEDESQCRREFFLDRYSLSAIAFSLHEKDLLIKNEDQCTWPSIICKEGIVTQINMQSASLEGHIPTELKLLTGLEVLKMPSNEIESIPTEVGFLTKLEVIDVSYNEITSIPSEIGWLTGLQSLALTYNDIVSIPSEIGLMTNFETLDLRGNQITSIPSELAEIESLVEFDFSFNQVTSIPVEIGTMTSLVGVNFRENKISFIPTEIGNLVNLIELDFRDNNITFIPSEIALLTNLERIDFFGNPIESFPDEIGRLEKLREFDFDLSPMSYIPSEVRFLTNLNFLYMAEKGIQYIPTEIGFMTELDYIILIGNLLEYIPPEIANLKKLERIDLTFNYIKSIPSEIGELTNLRYLELGYNYIAALPSEIGWLRNINRLEAAYNDLTTIPSETGLMANLEKLSFHWNMITSIPSDIGLLTNLQELEFSSNQITSIPTEIGNMTSLDTLDLDYNSIASIPTEIGLLTNLHVLDLTSNEIRSIPSEIALLTNLEELHLAYNHISSIPSEIQNLTNLKYLDLSGNQITAIPSEIGLLKNLSTFFILDNNITSAPAEIGSMSSLEVFEYNTPLQDVESSCGLDVQFSDCSNFVTEGSIYNDCNDPLQVVMLHYFGGGCNNSPSAHRFNGTCVINSEAPTRETGSPNYITATSSDGRDRYFAGTVNVGDEFTINSNKEFDMLPKDLTIQIFSSRGGDLLQTVTMDLTCIGHLFLGDDVGGLNIQSWIEISGREVGMFMIDDHLNRPTYDIPLLISATGGKPLRVTEYSMIVHSRDSSVNHEYRRVGDQILQPFSPPRPFPGIPLNHDLATGMENGRHVLHIIFTTVMAETLDGTEECNDWHMFECAFVSSGVQPFDN